MYSTRMSTQRAHYEPFAWWLTRERIGQDLRERYPALQELPSRLLALVEKLDASQSNQPPQCNVSFRHKADMQIAFSDVRFRG
jgi:hypothetical protein